MRTQLSQVIYLFCFLVPVKAYAFISENLVSVGHVNGVIQVRRDGIRVSSILPESKNKVEGMIYAK